MAKLPKNHRFSRHHVLLHLANVGAFDNLDANFLTCPIILRTIDNAEVTSSNRFVEEYAVVIELLRSRMSVSTEYDRRLEIIMLRHLQLWLNPLDRGSLSHCETTHSLLFEEHDVHFLTDFILNDS